MGHSPLVPATFDVPDEVVTGRFTVTGLTWDGFSRDYECYMSSVEHLQGTFNVEEPIIVLDGEPWPARVTPTFALIDAAWCHFERLARTSFAYVILDPTGERQLGCAYVFPCKKRGFDAECRCWVRKDEFDRGFDEEFYSWFREWMNEWPFDANRLAWPGRAIGFDEWQLLPDKNER